MISRICFGEFYDDHNCVACLLYKQCEDHFSKNKGARKGSAGAVSVDAAAPAITDGVLSPDVYEFDDDGNVKRNKDGSPRKRRGRKAT